MSRWLVLCLVVLGGCASFDGRGLVPGQSTAAEVEALMGRVTERRPGPDGSTVLWFSRQPYGRASFAATIGKDGKLLSLEQRLTVENLRYLQTGKTTNTDVHDLFGPPFRVNQFPRMQREIWTYWFPALEEWKVLFVQFSPDGILREYYHMDDPELPRLPASSFRR